MVSSFTIMKPLGLINTPKRETFHFSALVDTLVAMMHKKLCYYLSEHFVPG